jgi:uncharacterized protein (DUF1499 family)
MTRHLAAAAAFSLLAVTALALLLLVAGQLGWLAGQPPDDLGVRDGLLKPPSRTENSVSSQADRHAGSGAAVGYARIAPLPGGGDPLATLARLRSLLQEMPGARIVESRPDYLYVQFSTRWLKFTDDAEFWASPAEGVIHVRSASRRGRKDFGVNRARIEALRAALAAGPPG